MKPKKLLYFFLILFMLPESSAQEEENPPVNLKPVSGNVYEILDGRGSKGGAFIGESGILVIDSKMDEVSVEQTFSELQKLSDRPVLYLVNTHSDGDHIIGNRYFPESVTIISHENCRKDFFRPKRDGSPSDWFKPELAPFVPELTFSDKMDIHLGSDRVELWYFGAGHTTGDCVVYFPEEKIAFLGDQLFLDRPQLIHSHKGGNSFEYVATITKMLETLDASTFSSGHSDVCDRKTILKHLSGIKETQKKVMKLVEQDKELDEVLESFNEKEARLVTSIFNELQEKPE